MHRYHPFTLSKVRCRALLGKRTNTTFIARLCSGQPTAWAQLVDRWSPRLYSYLYYNTSDETMARRLLHAIMFEVIQAVIAKPQVNNLTVLIFGIAHRQVLQHCRGTAGRVQQDSAHAEQKSAPVVNSFDVVNSYFFNRFRQFPIEMRQVLLLRYVCGVPSLELAQIVGKPEETVLQMIERANIYFQ